MVSGAFWVKMGFRDKARDSELLKKVKKTGSMTELNANATF